MGCQSRAEEVVTNSEIADEAKEAIAKLEKLCEDNACQQTLEQESVSDSKNLE